MTGDERTEVLELVTEAVLQCEPLKVLRVSYVAEAANLVRREVARRLPAPTLNEPEAHV